jgi:hypothetical protein
MRQEIDFEFYFLDDNFYPKDVKIGKNEALLYVNYFGIMNFQVSKLASSIRNLIIDNSQAFYEKPFKGVDTFYSPRKFFGLPDGGFAYTDKKLKINLAIDNSLGRISHLLARIEDGAGAGYSLFQQNEKSLDNLPLRRMSKLTDKLLRNICFEAVRNKRVLNFNLLHKALRNKNELTPILEKGTFNCPMVYPFLKNGNNSLREKLVSKKIYVAKYWPNVIIWLGEVQCRESYLQDNLIAMPCDQRYQEAELMNTVKFVD